MKNKRNKKKTLYIKLIIVIVIFLLCGFYLKNKFLQNDIPTDIIAVSSNANYLGIGQKSISGKDGYVTTFTTFNGKTYKEYKQNGNSSWANRYYWGGTMAENGCGITCLATLASRL